MSSYSVFKDNPPKKEPVSKPAKLANTDVVKRLISLVSNSKNPEEASKEAISVLKSQQTLHKHRLTFAEEFEELKVLELELLEFRRFHKACLNEAEVRLYATKFLNLTVWMVALAIYILYINPSTEKPVKSERIMRLIFFVSVFILLCRLITMCSTFSYNLVHDGTPKIRSQIDFERIKKKKNEEITKMMLDEQLRLMDLFSKEVLPLKIKSEKVQYSQMYMKLASLIPIFGFYYICYSCFSARYDENPSSESINMFMAVLYPDNISFKEPTYKPAKLANTDVVKQLISLVSNSKTPEEAGKEAKSVLKSQQTLNKNRLVFEEEFEELRELELELLEVRRFHKACLNDAEVRLYATKYLNFAVWMVAIGMFLMYKMHCRYYPEKPIESIAIFSFLVVTTVFIFVCMVITRFSTFQYNLIHDGTPKASNQLDFERIKKKNNEEITKIMLYEQLRLMDLFTEEVLPLKTKSKSVQSSFLKMKLASMIPIVLFFYICYNCFATRDNEEQGSGESPFCFLTSMFAFVLLPVYCFATIC